MTFSAGLDLGHGARSKKKSYLKSYLLASNNRSAEM